MIDFLKESTFAVNDVVNKSWAILYKNYKNIAGLCLTMFAVLWMSGFLSSFVNKGFNVLNVIAIIAFLVFYFGLQLTLFNYILNAINTEDADEETFSHKFITFLKANLVKILIIVMVPLAFLIGMSIIADAFNINGLFLQVATVVIGLIFIIMRLWNQIKPFFSTIKLFWPSKTQLANFLVASVYAFIVTFLTFIGIGVLLFPLAWGGVNMDKVVSVAVSLGALLALCVLIRISFFPYFILDMDLPPFKSIRFSMAVTRGNFIRLLLLLGLIVVSVFLGTYLQAFGYYFLSLAVSMFYSFIIIPLSSVVTAVVYRQMTQEYEGDSDPDLMDNII